MARTKLTASKCPEPRPSTRSQPHSSPRSRTGIVISIPPSSSIVRNARGDASDNDNDNDNDNDSICSSSRSESKSDVALSRKSSNSKERGKEEPEVSKEPWRHPAELEYIRPPDWSEDRIITQLRSLVYSVPSPVFGKQSFIEITLYDEGDFSKPKIIHVPRGYRVPLMFVAKFQWASLKLVLTSAQREKEWDDYKFDILHLSRLSQKFFDDAKIACRKGVIDIPPAKTRAPEFQVEPGTMTRKWRCHTFDRALARYNKNWLISREEFVKDFYTEFQDEEYAKDVLKIDWSRWALKGHKGFKLTNDELRYGVDGKLLTRGLKKSSEGRWIWVDEFVIKKEEVISAVTKPSKSIASKMEKPKSVNNERLRTIVQPASIVAELDYGSIQREAFPERLSLPHTLPPSADSLGVQDESTSNKSQALSSDAKDYVTTSLETNVNEESQIKSSFAESSVDDTATLSMTAMATIPDVQDSGPPRLRKSSKVKSASNSASPTTIKSPALPESSTAIITTDDGTSQAHGEGPNLTVAKRGHSPSSVTPSSSIFGITVAKEFSSAAQLSPSTSTDFLSPRNSPIAQSGSRKSQSHSIGSTPIPHLEGSPFIPKTNMDDQSHDPIYQDNDEYDFSKVNERTTPTSIDSTPTPSPSIRPASFRSMTQSPSLRTATSMSDRTQPRLEKGPRERLIFDAEHTSQELSPRPVSISLDTPHSPDQIETPQGSMNALPQGPATSSDDKIDAARTCSPVFLSPLLPPSVDSHSDMTDDIPGLGGLLQQAASVTSITPFPPFPGPRHDRLPDCWPPDPSPASSVKISETNEAQTGIYTPPEEGHSNHVLDIQTSKEVQGDAKLTNEKELEGHFLKDHGEDYTPISSGSEGAMLTLEVGSVKHPPQTDTNKDPIYDDDSDMDFGTPVTSPLIIVPQSVDNLPDPSQLDNTMQGPVADGRERSFQTIMATTSRPEPSDYETASLLYPSQSGSRLAIPLVVPTSQILRRDSSTGRKENNTPESSNSIYKATSHTDGTDYPQMAIQLGMTDANVSSTRHMLSEEMSTSSISLNPKRQREAEDEPERSPTKRRREYDGLPRKDGGLVIRKVVSMVRDTLAGLNDLLEIAAERDLIPLDPTRREKGKGRMVDTYAEYSPSPRMSGERDPVSELQHELDALKTEMRHLKERRVKETAVESPDVLGLRTELQSLREQVKTLREAKISQPEPLEVRAMKGELNQLRNELRSIQSASRFPSRAPSTPSTPNLPARFNKETNFKAVHSAQPLARKSDSTPNKADDMSKQTNAVGEGHMDLDIPVPVKSKRKQHIMLPKT